MQFKKEKVETSGENKVRQQCLTPDAEYIIDLGLKRKNKWSLPEHALAADFLDTINILVLRFNFQYETIDDPNTTGRGRMILDDPFVNAADSAAYYDMVGHLADPPPRDSLYFDAHLRALQKYYETVSEGKLTLSWDIFPPAKDSLYTLPQPMNYYGKCSFDSVIIGLENYFIDCIQLADTVSPEIVFSDYQSIFLFHAGSDRQNDIGFPETCSDLFTGFISFGSTIPVDSNTAFVQNALMLPETASQDNRGTALNAVIAHEFGHQLGLVDLYNTGTFLTQLGDFALMDNNGFGTGLDFGFTVGQIFGAIPLFPMAWSRAHLGFVEVVDYRQNADLRIVAAEVISNGIKIARIPISENEYYLLENRLVDTDGKETALLADSATSVFQYPVDLQKNFTGEYDNLMPGSGLLIFHVDEGVAGLDYDNDGQNNFDDNDLQRDPDRRFIRLVEADGIVNFGGYYRAGFGREEDMYRDDRNNSFTPNTNPPSIDNSGNNSRVRLTEISRDSMTTAQGLIYYDSVITANLEIDGRSSGFPVRAGYPVFGLNPIVDDIDRDGTPELIVASGTNLNVITLDGQNFLRQYTGCTTCPIFEDSAFSSVSPGVAHVLPLYAHTSGDTITTSPVTGDFGMVGSNKFIAIGVRANSGLHYVRVYPLADVNKDGIADAGIDFTLALGVPIALSFGSALWALTDKGGILRKASLTAKFDTIGVFQNSEYHGIAQLNNALLLLAGDNQETKLYYVDGTNTDSVFLGDHYSFGPVIADFDRDGMPELAAFTDDGYGILLTIDTTVVPFDYQVLASGNTGFRFTSNPIAGDVDLDGYPDIIIGGQNAIYAFDRELRLLTDFPYEPSDRFPTDEVIAAPIMANIEAGGQSEIIFPTLTGNIYSFAEQASFGFPLSAGEIGAGSPVYVSDGMTGKLGYLGADGWFYLWDVAADSTKNFWPMGGSDPEGTYVFNQTILPSPKPQSASLPKERYYNYPNPVLDGQTTIRYYLGQDASSVSFKIFDLSGVEVAAMSGAVTGGIDNEIIWNCSNVTPGVYRCVMEVDFGGSTETAFTDIAVLR
ncbi:MAG: hypothetical protein IH931_00765 [candidate division Zixibacteria bacterium]|nr:hypothetical protein [candidate division Zixibacteria bacterium]